MDEKDLQKKTSQNWIWFLFSFKGRVSRKQFWIFNLFIFIGGILLGSFTDMTDNINEISRSQLMFMLWIFWPSLAVQAKRWHDIDKSALWLFINLVPVIGPIWALIQNGFMPGTRGSNRFGPDPVKMEGSR